MKYQTTKLQNYNRDVFHIQNAFIGLVPEMNCLHLLRSENEQEVLDFLRQRPVNTVVMASFIQDNGLVSKNNRGKFYCYRNADGKLDGVALIGHTTLIESRSTDSLYAFALIARRSETPIHDVRRQNNRNLLEVLCRSKSKAASGLH